MADSVRTRLADLGLRLPAAPPAVGAYVPFVIAGDLVFVSGQLPVADGAVRWRGRVGVDVTVEDGYGAARLCALNVLAQVDAACGGDLDRVRQIVRLGGFVNAADGFVDHPRVINGASELMVAVFGEAGRHARFAVGVPSLPLGAAVEIDAIVHIA
jgi:enamine deaminase RidA (YjgF/YER057c/UK114 family)